MKTVLFGAALVVAVFFLSTGCEDGGTGPHPMHELSIVTVSKDTALSGRLLEWGAVFTVSGSRQGMSTVYGEQSGKAVSNEASFGDYVYSINPENGDLDSSFRTIGAVKVLSWPTKPGSIDVTPARIKDGSIVFDNGFTFGGGYYPISGKIVITKVVMGTESPVYIEGYANGVLQSRGSGNLQELDGEKLTLHAMKFRVGDPIFADVR
jgi:hypothetical protein